MGTRAETGGKRARAETEGAQKGGRLHESYDGLADKRFRTVHSARRERYKAQQKLGKGAGEAKNAAARSPMKLEEPLQERAGRREYTAQEALRKRKDGS